MGANGPTGLPCQIGIIAGQLVIEPASDGGPGCRVVLGDGVKMTVDGQVIHERCEIVGTERIELDLGDRPATNAVSVDLKDRELEAEVTIQGTPGLAHRIMDQPIGTGLTIWREVERQTDPPQVEPRQISAALSEVGVRKGLMARAIAALIANPHEPHVVARGVPPEPSVDAILTLHLLESCQASPFFSVRAGALLASKTVARVGADGESVRGTPVPADPPYDPDIKIGRGVVCFTDPDGTQHFEAALDGRPVYDGLRISVEPTVKYNGDIDVSTGDVEVYGNLEVYGGVGEERKVWCSGDLMVSGGIEGAQIQALGAVSLQGPCLHSNVHSSAMGSVCLRLIGCLDEHLAALRGILAETSAMLVVATQAGQTPTFVQMARQATEARHLLVRKAVKEAVELLTAVGDEFFGAKLRTDLELILGVLSGFRDQASLGERDYVRALEHVEISLADAHDHTAPVSRVHYMQSSEFDCGGDLELTGQGVFTSEISVAGDFICTGSRATIRGGAVSVAGNVRAREIGAAGSARTVINLIGPTKQRDRLTAQRVHPGVRVGINDIELAYQYERNAVAVGVDDEGNVKDS